MLGTPRFRLIAGVMVLGMLAIAGGVFADDGAEDGAMAAMRQEMAALRNEVAQMRAAKGESWLNERRAEEVKALVREVLSDAETRASLLDSSMTAGHNGKHFYLASADGNYLMEIDGQFMFRHIWNDRGGIDGTAGNKVDGNAEGFQLRRTKLGFSGHAIDPKLTYKIKFEFSRATGAAALEEGWIAYEVADGLKLKAGLFYPQFTREEMVSSSKQQAVERSITNDLFTIDYTQGVALEYAGALGGIPVQAAVTIHDGSNEVTKDFNADAVDFAIAARIQAALLGKMKQFDDFATWSGDSPGLLVGGGFDYEMGEHAYAALAAGQNTDTFKWTVDASLEMPGLAQANLFVALYGAHTNNYSTTTPLGDQDMMGLVVQGGLFVIPDKMDVFGRYEYMDLDNQNPAMHRPDTISMVTVGTNYYIKKHDLKATLDVICVLDRLDNRAPNAAIGNQTGSGILSNSAAGQVALRAQMQLLF